MYLFAYLLFTNIAIMAGVLYVLAAQSKRRDIELAHTRLDAPTSLRSGDRHRTRRRPESRRRGKQP